MPTPAAEPPKAHVDLTVNKLLAGAGAAATSAVLGSFFGAAGTVAGAALGSVASTVVTKVYEYSLDRTQATVAARIRPVAGAARRRSAGAGAAGGGAAEDTVEATVPMPRVPPNGASTREGTSPTPAAPRWRRWVPLIGVTVAVFLLGMLVVTGIELVKGSTLAKSQSGTSVGRVLDPAAVDDETTTTTEPAPTTSTEPESSTEKTKSRSTDPSTTKSRSGSDSDSDSDSDQDSGSDPKPSSGRPVPPSSSAPTTTPAGVPSPAPEGG